MTSAALSSGLQDSVRPSNRERDRDRPGVFLAAADDDLVVEHPVPFVARHRPGQRAQCAVADAIQRRSIGLADRDAREIGNGTKFGHPAVDKFG